jgi:hypothetical protein
MDQEKMPLEIPKVSLSVLLECIADEVLGRADERADKSITLICSQIEYCYICHASKLVRARFRKVSKRIYKIDLQRVCGLPGYRISDIDLASGRPVHAGYYCDKCEREHQINRYLKQKAFDKGLKLTIYGRGNQRNL